MRLRAMAKINLGLDVLRKREDGYHEVRMIMQTIQMYDLLDIRKKEEPGISLSTNLPYVPSDERNLVYKAAKLLMDEFDIKEGLSMKLTKFIPVAAGMAGGSSDAAAAFVGVNRLFRLGLDEEGSTGWCGCSVLCYAWNCTCRRNWREADQTSGTAEMLCVGW